MIASLTFFGCFIAGLVVTAIVRDYAMGDLPREEVYEAIHRDTLAVKWSLTGWAISFVVSIILAFSAFLITSRLYRR